MLAQSHQACLGLLKKHKGNRIEMQWGLSKIAKSITKGHKQLGLQTFIPIDQMSKPIINILGADKLIQTDQPTEEEGKTRKKKFSYQCRRELGSQIRLLLCLVHNSIIIKNILKDTFSKKLCPPSGCWRTLLFFSTFYRESRWHQMLAEVLSLLVL